MNFSIEETSGVDWDCDRGHSPDPDALMVQPATPQSVNSEMGNRIHLSDGPLPDA